MRSFFLAAPTLSNTPRCPQNQNHGVCKQSSFGCIQALAVPIAAEFWAYTAQSSVDGLHGEPCWQSSCSARCGGGVLFNCHACTRMCTHTPLPQHTGLEEGSDLRNMAAFMEARAKGGVGLIVTGGIAPNRAGRVSPFAAKMTNTREAKAHRVVTEAVHKHGGAIAMQVRVPIQSTSLCVPHLILVTYCPCCACCCQILHSGRYDEETGATV